MNNTDNKQGANCIEFTGNSGNAEEFSRVFSSPFNSGVAPYNAILQFWYFISDASLAGSGIHVKLGSGGEAGSDAYSWIVDDLISGWNLVNLNVTDAGSVTGSPDLNAINWLKNSNNL